MKPTQQMIEAATAAVNGRLIDVETTTTTRAFAILVVEAALASMWQPIETAPKDGSEFLCLIGGVPYKAKYDSFGRFMWKMHTNCGVGAAYMVHKIDGLRLLEQTKEAEYNYKPSWVLWINGFKDRPTHWMPVPSLPEVSNES